jgi:hypothetical protein
MLEFHDFLIEYKQTPRSKILRRHLPKLDAVVEEDSILEYSYISTSEQKQSTIQKSSHSLPHLERSLNSQIFVFSNNNNEQYFLSEPNDNDHDGGAEVVCSVSEREDAEALLDNYRGSREYSNGDDVVYSEVQVYRNPNSEVWESAPYTPVE